LAGVTCAKSLAEVVGVVDTVAQDADAAEERSFLHGNGLEVLLHRLADMSWASWQQCCSEASGEWGIVVDSKADLT
jgi:hypothetical protein